jgi:DNA topoisomerase-1
MTDGNRARGGWTRAGSKGRFRYLDRTGRRIGDPEHLARIEALAIPPAWTDVWISPRPYARLQATGYDKAGRKQYRYHDDYRAAQEQAKYDSLIEFGARLPDLRAAMAEHLDRDELDRERVSAVALRLISLGWFRVGSERYAREGTYGVTTLLRRHVEVRGRRIRLCFRSKGGIQVRSELVDEELADAIKGLLAGKGGARVFKYRWEGDLYNLTSKRLNDYVKIYLGDEFSAKDFRTWGWDAARRGLLRRARRAAWIPLLESRAAAFRDFCHAQRRETTGKYARRSARLVRRAGRDRPIPRRKNDRRFSPAPIARRQSTGAGAFSRGTGDARTTSRESQSQEKGGVVSCTL